MSEERETPQEVSPLPDSISNLDSVESVNRRPSVVSAVPNSTKMSAVSAGSGLSLEPGADSPLLPDSSPGCPAADAVLENNAQCKDRTPPSIAPCELLLSGSSTSAFRPFITHNSVLPAAPVSSSSAFREGQPITSTPVSRRSERSTTMPGASPFASLQSFPQTSSPQDSVHQGESNSIVINGSVNDDNDDGRTTASAPPCTPAPEPHQQPQSPFRNNRQIKKIDLLAMSRSRQCDRAENARRDGRLAPSPRKKDEVLRNSGFTFPAGRGFGCPPNLRHTMHHNPNIPLGSEVSPERNANGSSSTASPNVDVVSVDEPQPDPTKCMFSIQFHDFTSGFAAEQMMKCNLCGFVTNNSRFYRRHRRMHSRQCQPNLIHCSLCDYSTSQIRKMREHTISHHHMSHPQNSATVGVSGVSGSGAGSASSSSQTQGPSAAMLDTSEHHLQQPQLQGHLMVSGRGAVNSANLILPLSGPQPLNLAPSGAIVPPPQAPNTQPAASSLGLPTYIPAPLDGVGAPPPHPHPHSNLQHPARSSNILGNYTSERHQQDMASYMQSVLSNLMTPHTNHGNSATSTGLLMQVASGRQVPHVNPHNPTLPSNGGPSVEESFNFRRLWNNNGEATSSNTGSVSMGPANGPGGFFKIKTEPVNHNPHHHIGGRAQDLPTSTQKLTRRENRRQSEAFDSESGMDMSSDDPTSSPQPPSLQRPRLDAYFGAMDSASNPITTSSLGGGDSYNLVQTSAVNGGGTQCPMPFIKIEFPPHREPCNFNHGNFNSSSNCTERSTTVLVDKEIQCEIISATNGSRANGNLSGSRHIGGRTQSETVSSAGCGATAGATGSSGSSLDTKCYYCGVTFDDEVLFSIHVGCHSHTDPFMCNVCGKQCYNKYGFYSHIMRGHQARTTS